MRSCHLSLPSIFCGLAICILAASAQADIAGFGDFSQFTINHPDGGSAPALSISTGKIQLTDHTGGERRSIFYDVPQSVGQFTASFNYQADAGSNFVGTTFVLQNSAAGVHAVGNNFNSTGFGYDGIGASAGITIDLGQPTTHSGLFTNGIIGSSGIATVPLNLGSGDLYQVNLTYNGSLLHEVIVNTSTLATFDTAYSIDLLSLLGGPTALVGFTANTGNPSFNLAANQSISDFHFASVPEPSSFGLAATAIIAMTVAAWRPPTTGREGKRPTRYRRGAIDSGA
jgi:hypothetical protein